MPSKFYYSLGEIPEQWQEEIAWYQLGITDSIVNRTRIAEISVSNPRNTKQGVYTAYKRCKIVESGVNATTFLGRVISSDPFYDETYGQSVKIVISDYISDLFERKVNVDYSSSAWKRSQIISQLITDYTYSGNIIKDIDASASSGTVSKNYTQSNQTPIQIIEGLAQEDPWDDVPTGYGYDYYVDDTQTFQYFKRGSNPVIGSALIIRLGGTDSATVRPMLHDYSFCDQPKEIITRVTCYGTANDGTKVSYTATDSSLESTLGTIKEAIDFVWGSNMTPVALTTYVTNRANALLNTKSGTITRGKFKFYRYPYVGSSASLVRVGDVVNIICSPQSISGSYLVLSVKYDEPPALSTMEVIGLDYGRGLSPFDLSSVLQGLQGGQDIIVTNAQISDLVVDSAHINSLEANKVIINGSITLGDWRATGDLSKFDGADVYTASLDKTSLNFLAFDKAVDDLDDVTNSGTTWGTILRTDISAGHIKLSSVSTSSNARIVTSSFIATWDGKPDDMDEIAEGSTYQKVRATQIDAGRIQLTAGNYYATKFSGTWYSMGTESGVDIDSVTGINIYGKGNALTTRATVAGTIQCYVGSDGKLYAGAGVVSLGATGIVINQSGFNVYLKFSQKSEDTGFIYSLTSSFYIVAAPNKTLDLDAWAYVKVKPELRLEAGLVVTYGNAESARYGYLDFDVNEHFVIGTGYSGDPIVFYPYNADIESWGSIIPAISNTLSVGLSGQYWNKMYANTYYGKVTTIQPFDEYDDIELLKKIKITKDCKSGIGSFPKELVAGDGDFVNILKWQSLLTGAVVQLSNTVDKLSEDIKLLEGKHV